MTIAWIDTETTGLDPARHEVWEIAVIVEGHRFDVMDGEHVWQVHPDLSTADPEALRVGRYYERRADLQRGRAAKLDSESGWIRNSDEFVAERLAQLLDGAHFVASNPAFDTQFIAKFLRAHGEAPTWRYHLIDVRALALGHIAAKWDASTAQDYMARRTTDLWDALGIEITAYSTHTAIGDARLARDVYRRVLGGAS